MRGGSFFSATPTGLLYFVDGFEETAFSLIVTAGFFTDKTGHFIVQGAEKHRAAFLPTQLTVRPQAEASPRHTDGQTGAQQVCG